MNISVNISIHTRLLNTFTDKLFTKVLLELYRETQIMYSKKPTTKGDFALSQEIGAARESDLIAALQWKYGKQNITDAAPGEKADLYFFQAWYFC